MSADIRLAYDRPTLPYDGGPRPLRAGDKLFAWLARGTAANGKASFLSGHISTATVEEAERRVGDGYEAIEAVPPEIKPIRGVVLYCWEVPVWHMLAVLKANGYEVKPPDDRELTIRQRHAIRRPPHMDMNPVPPPQRSTPG